MRSFSRAQAGGLPRGAWLWLGVALLAALDCSGPPRSSFPIQATSTPNPGQPDVERPPAILFASPTGSDAGGVDLHYLDELHQHGFEVDYTASLGELTWDRVQQYDALVLTISPDAFDVVYRSSRSSPDKVLAFQQLVDRYVESGGGLLLFPGENNVGKQSLAELTDRWGARIPPEVILENDPENVGSLTHSGRDIRLVFTGNVFASPVTNGVRGIWYPSAPAYFGGMSGPLVVDDGWQVVVRGSKSSVTQPLDFSGEPTLAPGVLRRSAGESEPALVAIRSVAKGRVALVDQWSQFSFGSGTRWTYNREVLDRGVRGRPSDFGRLFENMLRWVAQPGAAMKSVGGYMMQPDRLEAPNQRESVKHNFREPKGPIDPGPLDQVPVPASTKTYRGLIGAQTVLGGATGTVADYAQAAREAHLDFVVFLEPFERLTPAKLETLRAECARLSTDDLLLLPGFTIDSNLGDHLFFFSPDPAWPPDTVLAPSNKHLLYLQQEDGHGAFTGHGTPYLSWVLSNYATEKGQVGFYDFAHSPHGLRLHGARLYSMAGIRYYDDGSLVEDVLDEYLTTAQSTSAPAPVIIDRVTSPAALSREAHSSHSFTYAQAESLDANAARGLFQNALRWSHQYDAMPVFTSSGPQILSWPGVHRVMTYGSEGFAPGLSVMRAPLLVTAERGLKDISIYDGRTLFRRFAPNGARRFGRVLVLDGGTQKDLVVVARDLGNGVAVSYARRSWADETLAPVFCSDHVNDCRAAVLLAHGPYRLPFNVPPTLPSDLAGATWDGGPPASVPLSLDQNTLPRLQTTRGPADASRADQVPLLEMSDEGAVSVTSHQDTLYDRRLAEVTNPWNTFGPLEGGAMPHFDNDVTYRQWITATVGAPESGWAGRALREGIAPSLFTDVATFKDAVTVTDLEFVSFQRNRSAVFVTGSGDRLESVDLADGANPVFHLARGDWFGLVGKGLSNAQLCVNRGTSLRVELHADVQLKADFEHLDARPGHQLTFELACLGMPVDLPIRSGAELLPYLRYLAAPNDLILARGRRGPGYGVLEVDADAGVVELSLGRANGVPDMTLPLRVAGLNPRWSAALHQQEGYTPGFYGTGENRWRALGVDPSGFAYVPLYVDRADRTAIVAGHPITADEEGRDLFIQATCLGGSPERWHISVNNPTAHIVRTTLHNAMSLPGVHFVQSALEIPAGGYVVVE